MSEAYNFFRKSVVHRRTQLHKQGFSPKSSGKPIGSVSLDNAVACAFAVTEMAVVNIAEWSLSGNVSEYMPYLDDAAETVLRLSDEINNGYSLSSIIDQVEQLYDTIIIIGWRASNDAGERAAVGRELWGYVDNSTCLYIKPSPLSHPSGSLFIIKGVDSIVADRAIDRLAEQNVINMRPAAADEKLAYRFLVNYASAHLLSGIGNCNGTL
jgi:hypothetical protein